jgi:hypothetical protein
MSRFLRCLQHSRPCCIGYTNSRLRLEFVYPIQHGRSCCKHYFSEIISGGRVIAGRTFRKWFGVRGSSSFTLTGFRVSGRELAMRSASVKTVYKTSSLTRTLPTIAFKLLFTVRTNLSHTPDMCDAPGG